MPETPSQKPRVEFNPNGPHGKLFNPDGTGFYFKDSVPSIPIEPQPDKAADISIVEQDELAESSENVVIDSPTDSQD